MTIEKLEKRSRTNRHNRARIDAALAVVAGVNGRVTSGLAPVQILAVKHCTMCGKRYRQTESFSWLCGKCFGKTFEPGSSRFCRICGKKFKTSRAKGFNQRNCSEKCAVQSSREARKRFWLRNPTRERIYRGRAAERVKVVGDGAIVRFAKRFPDVPIVCAAAENGRPCGEVRVLDISHRPRFKRNGAWRTKANSTPEKVWLLCPTHHALLDRKKMAPALLGLPE